MMRPASHIGLVAALLMLELSGGCKRPGGEKKASVTTREQLRCEAPATAKAFEEKLVRCSIPNDVLLPLQPDLFVTITRPDETSYTVRFDEKIFDDEKPETRRLSFGLDALGRALPLGKTTFHITLPVYSYRMLAEAQSDLSSLQSAESSIEVLADSLPEQSQPAGPVARDPYVRIEPITGDRLHPEVALVNESPFEIAVDTWPREAGAQVKIPPVPALGRAIRLSDSGKPPEQLFGLDCGTNRMERLTIASGGRALLRGPSAFSRSADPELVQMGIPYTFTLQRYSTGMTVAYSAPLMARSSAGVASRVTPLSLESGQDWWRRAYSERGIPIAVKAGRNELLPILLEQGTPLDFSRQQSLECLDAVLAQPDMDTVDALVARAAFDKSSQGGFWDLFSRMMKLLRERPQDGLRFMSALEKRGYLTTHESIGRNAFHFLAEQPPQDEAILRKVAETLATAGADINLEDDHGHTPLELMAGPGYEAARSVLQSVGARPAIRVRPSEATAGGPQ